MKNLLLSLMTLVLGQSVYAASVIPVYSDFGVEAGFRQQSGSAGTTQTTTSQNGYQVGVAGFIPFGGGDLGVRSGLMYVNRPLSISNDSTVASGDAKITMTYFDVPVALAYKFSEAGYLFGGVSLAINLDSKVENATGALSGAKVTDVKTPIVPLLLGTNFKFTPEWGVTLFFESFGGDVANGLKNYRAVGANLTFSF